jgi:hypothetical protein
MVWGGNWTPGRMKDGARFVKRDKKGRVVNVAFVKPVLGCIFTGMLMIVAG